MTKLKDMKITAAEQKERDERMSPGMVTGGHDHYRDRYPYGLELRLDNETLEKLGLDKLPNAGKTVRIEAVAFVSSAQVREQTKDGKKSEPSRSLELQIRKLAVSLDPTSAEEAMDDAIG